jgi:hypothetical protein
MTLQSATGVPGTWTNVSATVATNGETVSVSLPRSAARQFYRLRQ